MSSATVHRDWIGRVIDGRFTLLEWLGGSELSSVFLTERPEDPSQKAAIKLIPADSPGAEDQLARWKATKPLSHPHLVRLFDCGRCQIDGHPLLYAVTEYAPEILSQILPERPLTPAETRALLGPILGALSYLHGKGFVHGHLKPSNLLVVGEQLKLSSDGLRAAGNSGKRFPATEIQDAPETAAGNITAAADLWSLGVTLVEALTQRPPVWNRSTQREPVVPESMPQPFFGIARECLRTDPARRCSLSNVRARLDPARALPLSAVKVRKTEPAKSHATVLVATVLVLIAVIAFIQLRTHTSSPALPSDTQQPAAASAAQPTQSTQSSAPAATSSPDAAAGDAVVERVMPDILPAALQSIRGQVNVKIRVTVDAGGNVLNATPDSPGPSKYFSKVALEAAQQWKFKPAQANGRAVSRSWILQFQFTQAGTEVAPVEAAP
jgi:TonB family protein